MLVYIIYMLYMLIDCYKIFNGGEIVYDLN